MSKKSNGGYVLIYVLVVVALLCAIVMSLCTVAVRGLQSQRASLEHTQQLYAAEGKIEQLAASVQSISIEATEAEALEEVLEQIQAINIDDLTIDDSDFLDKQTITATAVSGEVSVTAVLLVSVEDDADNGSEGEETYSYNVGITYDSYTVGSAEN